MMRRRASACGTSTLWNNIVFHPNIKWVSPSKEIFYFNNDVPATTMCDADLIGYQRQMVVQRLKNNRTDIHVGDWSTTYFSCVCCPVVLKTLNPDMKIIVVLRDPIQRTLSRFLEQKRNPDFPFHSQVANHTFATFVDEEVGNIEKCVEHASRVRTRGRDNSPDRPPRGWGAGMDMADWLEAQCYARRNLLGWSVYDVFLENYMAHFPLDQILVLYTNELATGTMSTMRKVEKFLGVAPHSYDEEKAVLVFNSRECYHWHCAKSRNEIREARSRERDPMLDATPFGQASARLVRFFRPHMQRLIKWAAAGKIAPVPDSWKSTYA
ncbi:hypothetical protein CHLRE_09g393000v5 [Chlamydomonas reinhardtii]|uniref:Sulfotransferase n=1 Tax=Chlamydomonas reinhardtii TaxID=3055 RepID=A0A2K3DDD1_CHLRE|nr:uncharacterized protein CHLRE_09g393000v5 [Chlamydomonas reinhardtii]PNW78540.1 hypothetical protein CHLRE_09g393000v5 [Chlamydomonas reinhardtii]